MQVVHLISSSGLYGAERTLCNLFAENQKASAPLNFSLALFCPEHGSPEFADAVAQCGVAILSLKAGLRESPKAFRKVLQHLKTVRPDLLHAHGYKGLAAGVAAAKLLGLPLVYTQHGFIQNTRKQRLYTWLDRRLCRLALVRQVICVSATIRDSYRKAGVAEERLLLLPNAVPVPELKERGETAPGPLVILALGRLSREKGPDILLESFAAVAAERQDCILKLAGDGPMRQELEARTQALGLSGRVQFLGFCSQTAELLDQADIYVLPSLTEGMPMALLEAMSHALPSVCTRVGEVPRILEQSKGGILVDAGSAHAFTAGLKSLLEMDVQARCNMGLAARAFVADTCSMSRYLARLTRIYQQAVG